MLVGPSGSGKTVLLTNMILDMYYGCFNISYIWSPSISVDNAWKPVKDYIRDHIKPNDKEKCYVDSYDPSELEQKHNKSDRLPKENKNIKIHIKYESSLMILPVTPILQESLNYYISYIPEVGIT